MSQFMYNGHILTKAREYMNVLIMIDGNPVNVKDLLELASKVSELQRLLTLTNEEADEQIEQLRAENDRLNNLANELEEELEQTQDILFEKNEAINAAYQILEQFQTIS